MLLHCPRCATSLAILDGRFGMFRCPKCKGVVAVPEPIGQVAGPKATNQSAAPPAGAWRASPPTPPHSIVFRCPKCQATLSAAGQQRGHQMTCLSCRTAVLIPEVSAPFPPEPPRRAVRAWILASVARWF